MAMQEEQPREEEEPIISRASEAPMKISSSPTVVSLRFERLEKTECNCVELRMTKISRGKIKNRRTHCMPRTHRRSAS